MQPLRGPCEVIYVASIEHRAGGDRGDADPDRRGRNSAGKRRLASLCVRRLARGADRVDSVERRPALWNLPRQHRVDDQSDRDRGERLPDARRPVSGRAAGGGWASRAVHGHGLEHKAALARRLGSGSGLAGRGVQSGRRGDRNRSRRRRVRRYKAFGSISY